MRSLLRVRFVGGPLTVQKQIQKNNSDVSLRKRCFGFQFGLRFVLIAIFAFSLLLFLWISPSIRQRDAVNAFESFGIEVVHARQSDLVPDWCVSLIGKDFFCGLEKVDSRPVRIDMSVPHITALKVYKRSRTFLVPRLFPNLRTLELHDDVELGFLAQSKNVKWIWVRAGQSREFPMLEHVSTLMIGSSVDSFDCQSLVSFPNLTKLVVSSPHQNGEHIGQISSLEMLSLGSFGLDKKQQLNLEPVESLKNLRELQVFGYQISDLTPLTHLDHLERLVLKCFGPVDSRDIYPMKGLRQVFHSSTVFSDAQRRELELHFPDVEFDCHLPSY